MPSTFSNRVYSQNSRNLSVCVAWITLEWLSVFGMNLLRAREKPQHVCIKNITSWKELKLFLFTRF